MRRTSDWKLIDYYDYDLQNTYSYSDFGAGVVIGEVSSSVWNSGDDDYNDTLNITVNITFTNDGNYEISTGLVQNQSGAWITGSHSESQLYTSGLHQVELSFSGVQIYKRGLNGPYLVSYISVSKSGCGEIARETDVHITDSYSYTDFDPPAVSEEDASLTGNYSSYVVDSGGENGAGSGCAPTGAHSDRESGREGTCSAGH